MALSPPLSPATESPDGELLVLARRGDRGALDSLARRHRQAAYLLALQLLGNPDDAMDAAQDSLMSFLGTLDRFQADRPVRPWLFSIVRNRCRDMRRRQRVRRAEPLENEEGETRPDLVDLGDSPETAARRRELRRRVWHALGELDAAHKEILVLRDYQDLSYAEIARLLRVPQGTVMSRLHRARKQLARRLEEEAGPHRADGGSK